MKPAKGKPAPGFRLTRRTLLKRGIGLSAGLVLFPEVVPARALGRGGYTAPSNRIVMAHIGVGGQGTQHIAGGPWTPKGGLTGRDDVQVIAVCDVNGQRREAARALANSKYGNSACAAYADFRELLARKDLDAVLIATGERWHPRLSMAAALAGKDMYCEKPTSLTIGEVLELRSLIERTGAVFQAGTQQRSSEAFRHACELARNGYIGQIREVAVGVGGPPTYRDCVLPGQPVPAWLNYDMWLGPAPYRAYNPDYVGAWMAYRDFSGGEMTNWGAHHFDIAQWGLGMDHSGPIRIEPPDGKEVKALTYHYAGGAVVTRDPDRVARDIPDGNGVVFYGSEGKIAVWRYDLATEPQSLKERRISPNDIHLHVAENHHTDFLNSVRDRSLPGANIGVASRSITVCHLGNIAYELGRPVEWDPAREQFPNDPEAERLFARPLRAPWMNPLPLGSQQRA